ncbi:unnamed protein product [Arabidopsis arenosa]|uniref:Uncharacterized protein n=1 Tax=Arabidopsis arenosa TaxID=38785 RepID=A0A8S2AE60_ARAAE|nr:unnamed protein product [Arabidopsis arenosa]
MTSEATTVSPESSEVTRRDSGARKGDDTSSFHTAPHNWLIDSHLSESRACLSSTRPISPSSGSSMSLPSHFRSAASTFSPNNMFSPAMLQQQQQRGGGGGGFHHPHLQGRATTSSLFPGIDNFTPTTSFLNFHNPTKQEGDQDSEELNSEKKRRLQTTSDLHQQQQQHQHDQIGGYTLQSSNSGSTATAAQQIPGNFWMVAAGGGGNNNQTGGLMTASIGTGGGGSGGGEPVWTFPSINTAAAALYRSGVSGVSGGAVSSGLHFMNFAAPMAFLTGQQQLATTSNHEINEDNNKGLLAI